MMESWIEIFGTAIGIFGLIVALIRLVNKISIAKKHQNVEFDKSLQGLPEIRKIERQFSRLNMNAKFVSIDKVKITNNKIRAYLDKTGKHYIMVNENNVFIGQIPVGSSGNFKNIGLFVENEFGIHQKLESSYPKPPRAFSNILNFLPEEIRKKFQSEIVDYIRDGIKDRTDKKKSPKIYVISETFKLILLVGKWKLFGFILKRRKSVQPPS